MAPAPPFLWPARSHSLVLGLGDALFRLCAYFEPHVRALIWGLSFAKFFFSIFFPENASQIGLRISEGIAPRTDQRERSPKRASDSKRAINPGSRGEAPALFLPISREKWGPPPGRRGPRGAAPQGDVYKRQAHFLSFDRVRRVYRLLGGVVGQAYQDGKQRMK